MGTVLEIAEFTFLVLLLCHLASCSVDLLTYCPGFVTNQQITGLQGLWTEWNRSTPNLETNLLNWKSGNCPEDITSCPCYNPTGNWGGVTCVRYDSAEFNCTLIWVVSLELSNASIVGTLPPDAFLNLSRLLVTLSLTGNPKLTGTLDALNNLTGPLNILDLHDNGFYGPIPTRLSFVDSLVQLDLSGNQLTGGFPNEIMNLTTLEQFSMARNRLNGNISYDAFHDLVQLFTVDLSGNNFTGPPPNFTNLNKLHYLNISYNSFTDLPVLPEVFKSWLPKGINQSLSLRVLDLSGLNIGGRLSDWNSSPDLLSLEQLFLNENSFIGELNVTSIKSGLARTASTSNSTLQVLSLMNNNITDVIFDNTQLTDGQIEIYLLGNPYCNDTSKDLDGRRCFCEQFCAISTESDSTKSYVAVISITTAICGLLLGTVILSLVSILKRKNKDMYALLKRFQESEVTAKRFEYSVLRTATKHFAQERKLGQGASGAVYKGILPNEAEIAVKQLFMKTQEASEDFLNEIRLITNLQHRNLVGLKGYSLHGREMLLVYDYVDYCDLEKLLFHGSNKWEVVTWPARMNICLGIAQGLYYLHASSQTRIIHRDIKASNILLDRNLNPKIADFGLARPLQDEKTETLTRPVGTRGYLAPDYVLYGQLSEKADVFSFGVLLLEIVSRKRNKDPTRPQDDIYLPTMASKLYQEERLMELIDPELQLKSTREAMEVQRVLETGLMCVRTSPEKRPSMFRVVAMLAGDSDPLDGPISPRPAFQTNPGSSDQDPESLLVSKGSEHSTNSKFVSLELSSTSLR